MCCFFCCLDSRNKSTSRSCIFYFPHFCFTRFFARNCYFVLFRKFSLFFLVFCCLSLWALADCLFPYIGKIVARSDYLARKLKIKATGKRTKRNKLKWNKHTANINVVQNYRFALNNLRNFIVLINFLPSDLRPRKNISHFHRIGIEKLLGSHFENWVCMMIESEYVRTFVCMYCGAATATVVAVLVVVLLVIFMCQPTQNWPASIRMHAHTHTQGTTKNDELRRAE